MLKANERRQKILEILCVRRQETMENLAQEFNVTTRTIWNDIEELTLAHPIETVRTKGIFICRSITPLKTKETIQGKTSGKCRVITFRKITNQLYRQRCGNRYRRSESRESVTGILDRTTQ